MQLNENNADKSEEIINKNEKVIPIQAIENRNYLYPDGHRMTHQMRWFKGSLERGLKSDIAARETIEINYFL